MIKLNTTYGVRAWNNKNKKAQPPPTEQEINKYQLTTEEREYYDKMKPPDRTNKYGTTAHQRVKQTMKPPFELWGGESND